MIKFITAFLLFNGLAWSQESEPSTGSQVQENDTKHNWSYGLFDDRTGISLVGYTYTLKETDKDELFVGGGTALLAFTATIGWKHYYRKSKPLPAKAGRLLFRLKVDLRLKPPEGLPAGSGLKATAGALL